MSPEPAVSHPALTRLFAGPFAAMPGLLVVPVAGVLAGLVAVPDAVPRRA
jgi:hypothetical protein